MLEGAGSHPRAPRRLPVVRIRVRRSLPFLAAILALAAALRLVGIEYGLPFGNLLDPDEQNIVPRAWEIVHGGGLDPHWFDYPSLLLYVLAPFQAWQADPSYLTARLVIAAIGVGGVAAAWWLGRAAYGRTAGLVAAVVVAVETIGVAYSHTAVTDVPMTALITVSLALAVTGRLEWAGVAAGLAASAKYPAVFLLVPLVVAGWQRWRRLAISVGLAIVAFLATSPFVLVHPRQAWDDASRVQRLARDGLARLRARLVGALLVHREAVGGPRPGAGDRRRRPRAGAPPPHAHRPDPRRRSCSSTSSTC